MRYEKPEMRIEAFELITVTEASTIQTAAGTLTYTEMVADKADNAKLKSTISFN